MIDVYSWPTPNGHKVHVMLEETGLDYNVHPINIQKGDQFAPDFLKISPNNRIPAIVDQDGPGGKPYALFESGAILIYLAEKTGKLLPADPAARIECIQWLMFQMGGVGPMVGQLGHFYKFAADKITDPYPTDRYVAETKRLLNVLNKRPEGRDYIMGEDFTIADIATFPWIRVIDGFYGAGKVVGLTDYANVTAYVQRCASRPAVATGLTQPSRD